MSRCEESLRSGEERTLFVVICVWKQALAYPHPAAHRQDMLEECRKECEKESGHGLQVWVLSVCMKDQSRSSPDAPVVAGLKHKAKKKKGRMPGSQVLTESLKMKFSRIHVTLFEDVCLLRSARQDSFDATHAMCNVLDAKLHRTVQGTSCTPPD